MKYVKLFESWLNEAEEEIKNFDKEKPRDWPVMKTTIKMVYSGANGNISFGVLESILGRANQGTSKSKKFNKFAEISVTGIPDGPSIENSGNLNFRGNLARTGLSYKEFYSKLKKIAQPNSIADNVAIMKNIFAIGVGPENKSVTDYADNRGMCLILLPKNIKNILNNHDSEVIKLNAIVLYDRETYQVTLSNLLAFINDGMDNTQFLIEDQSQNVNALFAGETKSSLIAFEKTIGEKRFIAAKRGDEDTNDPNMKARDGVFATTAEGTEFIGQILFEFDKAVLTQEAKKVLDSKDLRIACSDATKSIKIVGHADGKGDAAYNKKLSMQRAESVLEYMKTLNWWKKIDASTSTEGLGSTTPVMDDKKGTDPVASSLNRRVEFIIDDNKPNYDAIKKELSK